MAVYLTLRQIREEVFRTQHGTAEQTAATGARRLLSAFFRDVFAELVGADPRWNWSAALVDQDPDPAKWRQALELHCYRQLVAHRLERYHEDLQAAAADVCVFWWALQALCDWMVERLWYGYQQTGQLLEPGAAVKCDLPLEIELKEGGWTDSVRLTEIEETVWRPPGAQSWCVAELGFPGSETYNSDKVSEACLHYLLLRSSAEMRPEPGNLLALVVFQPQRSEQTFPLARLEATLKQAKAQIGQMAGVVPNWLKTVHDVQTTRELPTQYEHISSTLLDTLREYGAPASLAGPPQVGHNSLRFTLIPGDGVQVAKIKQLADALRLRLRLRSVPLIDASGAEVMISIERANRPIVFYWPS